MVYSYSRLVESALIEASKRGVKFSVIVAESRPNCEGYELYDSLKANNILCKLIVDSAIGSFELKNHLPSFILLFTT